MKAKLTLATVLMVVAILACNMAQEPTPAPTSAPQATPARPGGTVSPQPVATTAAQPTAVRVTPPPNVRGHGFGTYQKISINLPNVELIGTGVVQNYHDYAPFSVTHYRAEWVSGADRWPEPSWPVTPLSPYLYGPDKRELETPLVIQGDFKAGVIFRF